MPRSNWKRCCYANFKDDKKSDSSFRNKMIFNWPLRHKKLLLAKTKFIHRLWKGYQVFWPESVLYVFNISVPLKEGYVIMKDELNFSKYYIFSLSELLNDFNCKFGITEVSLNWVVFQFCCKKQKMKLCPVKIAQNGSNCHLKKFKFMKHNCG